MRMNRIEAPAETGRGLPSAVWLAALAVILTSLPSFAGTAAAQFALEVRAGVAIGNHAPARAGFEGSAGLSVSGLAEYAVRDDLSVYGTYTYGEFSCEHGFCADRQTIISNVGGGIGVRVTPYDPFWVRAGVLFTTGTVETALGIFSGDVLPGYELGVGIDLPLPGPVALVSGVGYRSQLDAENRTSVLNAEAGLRVRVGGSR